MKVWESIDEEIGCNGRESMDMKRYFKVILFNIFLLGVGCLLIELFMGGGFLKVRKWTG